jgi:diamine N-acetyltransferase
MKMMIDLSSKPHIEGEKVILRPFCTKDLPFIEECLKDSEVIKLTGSTDDYDEEAVLRWYLTRNEQIDRLDLAVVDKALDVLVGEVVANLYEEEKGSMNFRILIGPRGRDRGLGTEATRLFINHLFRNTRLNQLTLSFFDFNPRAKRVYEKLGFVVESVDKDELEYERVWIDSINMVLTRDKWLKSPKGE